MKWLAAPFLLLLACILAGLYGAMHNQISYTIAPEYFHAFKFEQFVMPGAFRNRLGAALVGILASWWMGALAGLPILMASIFHPGVIGMVAGFLRAALAMTGVTLLTGLGALFASFALIGPDTLPWWALQFELANPVAFARAGMMHNFSYVGALAGLLVGLAVVFLSVRDARRDFLGTRRAPSTLG